jgi:dephospho-CoA kinase
MNHNKNVKILAFLGLPGSGKSSAVNYLAGKGHPRVYFGGIILQSMDEAGLERTQANEKKFREELREREGKDFVANRIVTQIRDLIAAGQHRIVADGLYTWTEYKVLKHEFPGELVTVAIVAPKHIRHHRLARRPTRPLTEVEANQRDWAEIEMLEKGGPIAIADHYIINAANLDELHVAIDAITKEIEF